MKKLGRTPLRFQTTFHTPLKDLESFVGTILGSLGAVESGIVTIDAVISADKLKVFLRTDELGHDTAVIAESADEAHRLLVAVLGDWVDYATFYANTKSNLNKVASALETKGFKRVEGHVR